MPLDNLNNPPLVEVVFEVKFKDPRIVDYELLVGEINSKLKATYKHFESLKPPEMPALLMPFIMQHRFRVDDGKYPLYQIGPGIVSFNYDGDTYTKSGKWENFRKKLLEFITIYKEVIGDKFSNENIEYISLRYINKIVDTGMYPGIHQYFTDKLGLKIDLDFAGSDIDYLDKLEHTRLTQLYFLDDTKKTKLKFDLLTITEDTRKLLLDISITTTQIPTFDSDTWLNDVHNKIENFFIAITKNIKSLFE